MLVKRPSDSLITTNELVIPNDTNSQSNLFGGRLLQWMDIAAALSAAKHAGTLCVTAAVDKVSFTHPIKLGEMVTIQAKCVRSFNTSMEVYIQVWSQDLYGSSPKLSNEAFYTFVAIDKNNKPISVPPIEPLSEEEIDLFNMALLRKQLKLLVAGRITLKEAPELKKRFLDWIEEDNKPIDNFC